MISFFNREKNKRSYLQTLAATNFIFQLLDFSIQFDEIYIQGKQRRFRIMNMDYDSKVQIIL